MYASTTVVDVGDGACSILRGSRWADETFPVAVLDCGVYRARQRRAAERLLDALGPDLPLVDRMVVSHWDADHWQGLAALADLPAAQDTLGRLTIQYPAMPQRLRRGILAFVTHRSATGTIPPLLQVRMRPVMRPGAAGISLQPLARGQSTELAGRRMAVLWPPPQLTDADAGAVTRVLDAVDELAEDLADQGFPDLADNLRDLQQQLDDEDPGLREDAESMEETARPPGESAAATAGDDEPVLTAGSEVEESIAVEEIDAEESHGSDTDVDLPLRLPQDAAVQRRVRRVFRRVRSMNNDLSLVLAAEDGTLLALGDAGDRAVARALRWFDPPPYPSWPFHVILAPHHGSIPVPPELPPGVACISQAGRFHDPHWSRHTDTHAGGRCTTTATSGTVTVIT